MAVASNVVVDEGAEGQDRQAPVPRIVQGEGDQLAAEAPPLELFVDLRVHELDQPGSQPVLQKAGQLIADADLIALAIGVIGDCDGWGHLRDDTVTAAKTA